MKHRSSEDVSPWMLDGRIYGCEAEFRAALAKRAARRRRVMALIEAELGAGLAGEDDGEFEFDSCEGFVPPRPAR
jgi:hypothetical protein